MRRFIVVVLFGLLCFESSGQIKLVEYFIDMDPGFGKGERLQFTVGKDVKVDFTLSLKDLTVGLHVLNIRTMDINNAWSTTSTHTFFLQDRSNAVNFLSKAEYFIDKDPGFGKGIAIPIVTGQKDTDLNFVVNLKSATLGVHTLFLRSLTTGGNWSHTQSHPFYIGSDGKPRNIVALTYNFTAKDYASEMFTKEIAAPGGSIIEELNPDLSKLPGDKEYDWNVFALADDGSRSFIQTRKIKICNGAMAKARFDYVSMGKDINFIDSTAGAFQYRWDFGDGKTDTISNPAHTYKDDGIYKVTLIASNLCNSDTLTKTIHVLSLQSSFPKKGGNTGTATITLTGSGFTSKTKVRLSNGSKKIEGYEVLTGEDGKSLTAVFELYDQQLGNWDVVVIGEDNIQTKLSAAFEVQLGQPYQTQVDIIGRSDVRSGMAQKYSISVQNTGNTDLKGVFLWIAVPKGTALTPVDFDIVVPKDLEIMKYSPQLHFSTDSLFDKPQSADVYGFTIRKVETGKSRSLDFEMKFTSSGEVSAWTSGPLYGSPMRADASACIDGLMGVVDVVWEGAKFVPIIGCGAGLLSAGMELYDPNAEWKDSANEWDRVSNKYMLANMKGEGTSVGKRLDYGKALMGKYVVPVVPIIAGAVFDCLGEVKIAKIPVFRNWADDMKAVIGQNISAARNPGKLMSKAEGLADGKLVWNAFGLAKTATSLGECAAWIKKQGFKKTLINIVASLDPNEKLGPSSPGLNNPIQGTSAFNYVINFENKNTATAPAQEVIVLDTLDAKHFDLSTFQLKGFGFGTSTVQAIPSGLDAFATSIDLRPAKNMIVRVDAKLDREKGILRWRFLSLDPVTMELTDDPLDGFLPPNGNDHRGEGYIAYSVQPKINLTTGTAIENKSSIYFDNNKPIVTNTFINTIDKSAPTSKANVAVATSSDTTIHVNWSGVDPGSGVRSYDIYYAVDDAKFQLWLDDTGSSGSLFNVKKGHRYKFYSIARDFAGNVEAPKTSAETEVKIKAEPAPEVKGPATLTMSTSASVYTTLNSVGNIYVWTVVGGKMVANGNSVSVVWERPGNGVLTVTETDPELKVTKSAQMNVLINPANVLAANNFTIEVTSATCKGYSNGSLKIKAAQHLNYTALLTGSGLSGSLKFFTENLDIPGLKAGTYELTIGIQGDNSFSRLYNFVVTEPAELSVYTAYSAVDRVVELSMNGSALYYVKLNGKTYQTQNGKFDLKLNTGVNKIQVTTDQICQGIFEHEILVEGARVYPNPVTSVVNIVPDLTNTAVLDLEIRNTVGKLMYAKSYRNAASTLAIDISHFPQGMYIMRLKAGTSVTIHKIIKE